METANTPQDKFYNNLVCVIETVREVVKDCRKLKLTTLTPEIIDIGLESLGNIHKGKQNEYNSDQKPNERLITHFVEKIYEHWDSIFDKDDKFFEENANKVFEGAPTDQINAFSVIYKAEDKVGKRVLVEEDDKYIWDCFHAMVKQSIRFVHEKREPVIRVDDKGTPVKTYQNDFANYVDVPKSSKKWNVKLEWQ